MESMLKALIRTANNYCLSSFLRLEYLHMVGQELKSRNEIEGIAEDTIERVYKTLNIVPPISVTKIANALDIKVYTADMNHSGELENNNGAISIYINKFESPSRQRFTIAHELGHHVLGHERTTPMRREDSYIALEGQDLQEREANRFAASLLMPEFLIKKYIKKYGHNVDYLKDIFQVSAHAMKIRLARVGYGRD